MSDYEKAYYNGLIDSAIALDKRINTLRGKAKESAQTVLTDYKLRISDIENGRTSPSIKKIIMRGSKERITQFYEDNKVNFNNIEFENINK